MMKSLAESEQGLTMAFFSVSGLDLLSALDVIDRSEAIEWIYSLQVLPPGDGAETDNTKCGFRGSSTINCTDSLAKMSPSVPYDCSHVAMTYTGLACLVILGDDLSRVNKPAVMAGLQALQLDNGSFCAMSGGSENDMRFVYCASAVCYILQDWSGMDRDRAVHYIINSISFDGGIGQGPALESHGGSTYCAVASLALMGRLTSLSEKQLKGLWRWCLWRQHGGFQGRPNKPEDTCYSFWVGATLQILNSLHLVDTNENRSFVLTTQDEVTGGFSKWPDTSPDLLHTYLGISGLSLIGEEGVLAVDASLNISQRAAAHLQGLHQSWRQNS